MTTGARAPLTTVAAWRAIQAHYAQIRELHLRHMFPDDPERREHCRSPRAEHAALGLRSSP